MSDRAVTAAGRLHTENEQLRDRLAALERERDEAQAALARAAQDRDISMRKRGELERELAEARESDEAWMMRVYPYHAWSPDDGLGYMEFCHTARAEWEAEHRGLKDALAAARERIVALEGTLSVRIALRREVEALLGVDPSEASEEQYAKGVAALRAVIADRDAARAEVERLREGAKCGAVGDASVAAARGAYGPGSPSPSAEVEAAFRAGYAAGVPSAIQQVERIWRDALAALGRRRSPPKGWHPVRCECEGCGGQKGSKA